jgi:Ca2+-binding EF-hand superfamily protein
MKNAFLISATALAIALAATSPSLAMGGGMAGGLLDPDNFDLIDTDKDGKLSKSEIEAHRAAGFAEADTNKDGKLSVEELTALHAKRAGKGAERMLEHLDDDEDGMLSKAEMSSTKRGERMFSRIDSDEDGLLSKAELEKARAYMKKRGKHGMHGQGHGNMDE